VSAKSVAPAKRANSRNSGPTGRPAAQEHGPARRKGNGPENGPGE
jgi:hypothetical protein